MCAYHLEENSGWCDCCITVSDFPKMPTNRMRWPLNLMRPALLKKLWRHKTLMTSQLFNLCELRQIHATDFASEGSLTLGIIFIRATCKLFEFLGF